MKSGAGVKATYSLSFCLQKWYIAVQFRIALIQLVIYMMMDERRRVHLPHRTRINVKVS